MSWSTDRNGEGWFEKEGEAPEGRSASSQAPGRDAERIMRAALEEIANDPYQYGQRVQRMKRIAAAALESTSSTERQREKAEQERLCRSEDLHEYLTLKGETS